MSSDDQLRTQLRALCAELGPEDGLNARDFYRKKSQRAAADRRAQSQLCGQIARALNLALSGASIEALRATLVHTVTAPRSGEVEVTCVGPPEAGPALDLARGWLRTEVASAIHRKRVPRLSFVLLPAGCGGSEAPDA